MSDNEPQVMGWPTIIGILLATGFLVGLTIGLVTWALGISSSSAGAGVGAAVGIMAVALISKRRAALEAHAAQKKD